MIPEPTSLETVARALERDGYPPAQALARAETMHTPPMRAGYGEPGAVSTDTLRREDLLLAFWREAEYILEHRGYLPPDERAWDPPESYVRSLLDSVAAGLAEGDRYLDSEESEFDLDELMEALEAYALPGYRFGAHWSDGACFGYWPLGDD